MRKAQIVSSKKILWPRSLTENGDFCIKILHELLVSIIIFSNCLRSKEGLKALDGTSEDANSKQSSNSSTKKDEGAVVSPKHHVIDNNELFKKLPNENKDILSDGSDSDALVIDMGMQINKLQTLMFISFFVPKIQTI